MNCYNEALKIFESHVGSESTYSDQLDAVGKYLWKSKWKGVLPSDAEMPRKGYYIINVDKREDPGSHWMAVCDNMLYDSFGRYQSKLVPHVRTMDETEHNAEQGNLEENCGARSLAWIFVYDAMGREIAHSI